MGIQFVCSTFFMRNVINFISFLKIFEQEKNWVYSVSRNVFALFFFLRSYANFFYTLDWQKWLHFVRMSFFVDGKQKIWFVPVSFFKRLRIAFVDHLSENISPDQAKHLTYDLRVPFMNVLNCFLFNWSVINL